MDHAGMSQRPGTVTAEETGGATVARKHGASSRDKTRRSRDEGEARILGAVPQPRPLTPAEKRIWGDGSDVEAVRTRLYGRSGR